MKRRYFQKKNGTNDDLKELINFWNLGYYDGDYYWAERSGDDFIIKKTSLMGITTTEHTVDVTTLTSSAGSISTLTNIILRVVSTNSKLILNAMISWIDAGGDSAIVQIRKNLTDAGAYGDDMIKDGSVFEYIIVDIFVLDNSDKEIQCLWYQHNGSDTIHTSSQEYDGAFAIRDDSLTISLADIGSIYPGVVYNNRYYFVSYNGADMLLYYYRGGGFLYTLVETLTNVLPPTTSNLKIQLYWIQSDLEVMMDSDHLNTRWKGGTFVSYASASGTFVNGVIWGYDHLGKYIIKYILWGGFIWEVTDKGILKRMQALEPRDYKKVYLSNLNANLPGVVQFQDANGNDDLSAWDDQSGADCTVSVVPIMDGHENVMKLDDQSNPNICLITLPFSEQITGSVEVWVYNTSANRIQIQLNNGTTTFVSIWFRNGNIEHWGTGFALFDIGDYDINTWVHLRMDFSCTTDTFSVWINGVIALTDGEFLDDRLATTLDIVDMRTSTTEFGNPFYVDGLGFSWDAYVAGSNKKINAFVGFLPNNVSAWDHKLTYQTNEVITGVVQIGTAADPDLSGFTTQNVTLSVESSLLRHNNVMKILATANNSFALRTFTEITTSRLEGWHYIPTGITNIVYVMGRDGGTLSFFFQFEQDGDILTNTSVSGTSDTGVNFAFDTWFHWAIDFTKSGDVLFYVNGSLLATKTMAAHDIDNYRLQITTSGDYIYIDALGEEWESYVAGSNNVFPDLTFPKPWFATGDPDTGLMQIALKDWTPGTIKALVESEMYKAPKYSLVRLTPPFEDEWVDQFTDVGQHFYGGKVADNNNDNRFFWLYLMKNWQDENGKTKINETLLGYTHKEMLEFVIDKYSKYRYYGAGTNGNVNEFTPNQIDGSDDDWTNSTVGSGEENYVTKKGFLNGFLTNVLELVDDAITANYARIININITGITVFSGKWVIGDTTKAAFIRFYEGATRIGYLTLGSTISWWDGGSQILQTGIVANTIYHWAAVFNASADTVDLYIDGIFKSTENVDLNITTEIDAVRFRNSDGSASYESYHSQFYKGNSLVDAMHTFSSISPLLTTTQDFHLKNMSFPALEEQIAEETGYIVSERPDGQVYVDQYGASGQEINAQVAITFQSLMQIRNEKFSFITLYGGFINGIQITAEGFGEPNFGSYEDWFPMIQGRDADDVYYDADGNPKSHRLDAMVTTALANKNIVIKKQVVGKRGIGMLHVGQSLTYTTDHYKIAGETWNAWRKNVYDAIADDNRVEIADSFLSPTRSDPDDDPTAAAINDNTTNITKNDQNIAYLAERTRSRDVLSVYIEENTRNLDQNVWGFFTALALTQALNSGSPINTTAGCHRILFLVNAGSDVDGTLTITGTTRDRSDTSLSTPADTEVITIDSLSTDNSSTDAQGNVIHEGENLFISDKWFEGAITITTTNLTITDVDVYGILYHQFDAFKLITLKTLDFTARVTNAAGWFYAYLYLVQCVNTNKKYDVTNIVAHEVPVGTTVANKGYRRRKVIDQLIDGNAGHGVWMELFFGPAASTYWQDISIYLTALLDDGTDE